MKYQIQIKNNKKILVSGILAHSMYPPSNEMGYWRFLIPDNFIPQNVLVLGLGGGTICKLLLDKFPNADIVAVDSSKEVARLAIEEFNLDASKIKITINDAYKIVNITKEKAFDLIIIDLFVGEWFSYQTIAPSFLSQCQKILKDDGKIVINTINPQWMINKTFPFVEVNQQQGNIIYTYTKET